jgi:hypothetical protein
MHPTSINAASRPRQRNDPTTVAVKSSLRSTGPKHVERAHPTNTHNFWASTDDDLTATADSFSLLHRATAPPTKGSIMKDTTNELQFYELFGYAPRCAVRHTLRCDDCGTPHTRRELHVFMGDELYCDNCWTSGW